MEKPKYTAMEKRYIVKYGPSHLEGVLDYIDDLIDSTLEQ